MIFLGVDPGFQYAGFGVVMKNGSRVTLLDCGFLQMSPNKSLPERVEIFYNFFKDLVIKYQVNVIVLETPFLGKNAQNFLKLGYLRGILYLIASQNRLKIMEFTPTQVKLGVTGYGGANKEQVARVIGKLFPKLAILEKMDITDAVAVALCGVWSFEKNSCL